MPRSLALLASLFAFALAGVAPTALDAAAVHQAQVEARAPWTPYPVEGSDGRLHLAFELHVTNFYSGAEPLLLKRLAVFAGAQTTPMASFSGAEIDGLLAHPQDKDAALGVRIEGGRRKVLFLWIDLPSGAPTPAFLRQRIEFETKDGSIQVAEGVVTPVGASAPLVIGPPLRGGAWLASEGPGNRRSHHWGSLVAIDGLVTIPQRFAIDWFGIDAGGYSLRTIHPINATVDADWVGFGADVLAVADGVVRDLRDGVADGRPLAPQAEPDDLTARTLYGNFIVLEIAPKVFVHYAHLKNGSARVKLGEHVSAGTVIGALGQTGGAGAPHLHFQVSNAATFEESEGLPFVVDRFDRLGSGKIEDTFDRTAKTGLKFAAPTAHRDEMPLDGDLVRFAGR